MDFYNWIQQGQHSIWEVILHSFILFVANKNIKPTSLPFGGLCWR